VFVEIPDVGVAAQEPEQFMDNRAQMELLGCDHGKARPQIKPRLRPENADRPRAGAVGARLAMLQHMFEQTVVFLHAAEN
jgi:hypothetical protein